MTSNSHSLKTWPDAFRAVELGEKKAEFLRDDRGFRVHDQLVLREWDQDTETYSGSYIAARVTHIAEGGRFGIPDGFCILSIDVIYCYRRPTP